MTADPSPRIAVLGADGRMGRALIRAVGGRRPSAVADGRHRARRRRGDRRRTPGLRAGIEAGGRASSPRRCPPRASPTSGSTSPTASATESVNVGRRRRRAPRWSSARPASGTHARAAIDVAAHEDPDRLRRPTTRSASTCMLKLVADAARALGPGYDLEIVEAHHRAKRDAPSGTALRLAEALAEATGRDLADRRTLRAPRRHRPAHAPARSASRPCAAATWSATTPCSSWATATGWRSPTAPSSRDTFAVGAVRAALWVAGREPGPLRHARRIGIGLTGNLDCRSVAVDAKMKPMPGPRRTAAREASAAPRARFFVGGPGDPLRVPDLQFDFARLSTEAVQPARGQARHARRPRRSPR